MIVDSIGDCYDSRRWLSCFGLHLLMHRGLPFRYRTAPWHPRYLFCTCQHDWGGFFFWLFLIQRKKRKKKLPAGSSSHDRFATVLLGKSMINQSIIHKWVDEWVDDWHDAPCLSLSVSPSPSCSFAADRGRGGREEGNKQGVIVAVAIFFNLSRAWIEFGRSGKERGLMWYEKEKAFFLSLLYGMNADGNLTHWLVGLLIDWLSMGVRYGSDVEWKKGK